MKTCSSCARHLLVDEGRCPFCAVAQSSTGAPRWTRLVAMGVVLHASACVDEFRNPKANATDPSDDDGETFSSESESDSATTIGSQGEGEDTIGNDDDPYGEGSTYAGPDEDTMIWGETETETDTFEGETTVAMTETSDTTTDEGETTVATDTEESTTTGASEEGSGG